MSISEALSENLEHYVNSFMAAIKTAATDHIPWTVGHPSRMQVLWWNAEVKKEIRDKRRALNIYKQVLTKHNLLIFKRLWAANKVTALKKSRWGNVLTLKISS